MALDSDRTTRRKRLQTLLWGKFSLWRIVRSILFVYLAIGGYAFFFAERQIFQPQPSSYQALIAPALRSAPDRRVLNPKVNLLLSRG